MFKCWLIQLTFISAQEDNSGLRVIYVLSENVECVIDSALEVGGMEALCEHFPPANIHLIANVLVDTFQLQERKKKAEERTAVFTIIQNKNLCQSNMQNTKLLWWLLWDLHGVLGGIAC